VTTVLGLERDAEAQMRRLRPATRQQLAQGLRNPGLVVDDRLDEPALRQFAALIASTRRRKGSLTYPWRFYSELRTAFVEPGFARIERAFLRGQCIAALLTFRVGRTAIYGYGAATGDQAALRARPMNVLMWRAIGWAREQGADVFDFGSSPASQEGLIHFKEGWGSVTEPLPYYVWDRGGGSGRSITQDGLAARLAARVLRHMPEPLFSRLTPYLLRQVG
jgi:lipid II:glycine glycyltransferase (peptidoglycan interpeptide bridge formation enzyme)